MGCPAKYPPEFQREAVEFVSGSGRSINEVALSLGIKRGTLGSWVKGARDVRDGDANPDGLSETERAELRATATATGDLELRADREILRKAAAYFTPRDDAVIRFRFVEDHRGVYDVKRMCALVEVPRSSSTPGPPDQPRRLRPGRQSLPDWRR
jgi:transposase